MKSGLLISLRVLFKNKLFTAINLLNLMVGIVPGKEKTAH